MENICILTSVHTAYDVRIFHKEARSLAQNGYKVTSIVQGDYIEDHEGIKTICLPKARSRFGRMTITCWQILEQALKTDAQVYHFHDPELIWVGIILKIAGKKVIYDVHEDVPRQIQNKLYLPYIVRNLLSLLISGIEFLSAIIFDGIISATPKIATRFPSRKTIIVHNYPILHEVSENSNLLYKGRPLSFAYVGGISEIRGVKELIQAMEIIKDIPNAKLEIAGEYYPVGLENKLKSMPGFCAVNYHGHVSRKQVSAILSNVRAGIVTLHPRINYLDSYPVKMFEYMSAGLPIIASDFPLWRRILEENHCGVLVDPQDPYAIANMMRWIIEHPDEAEAMGSRGKQLIENKYNWYYESEKLLTMYNKIINDGT